eukprot:6365645-Pyramimonas_sp.AAC.1
MGSATAPCTVRTCSRNSSTTSDCHVHPQTHNARLATPRPSPPPVPVTTVPRDRLDPRALLGDAAHWPQQLPQ